MCRWLHEKHSIVTKGEGEKEIVAVAWDITERKRTERMIQARAELLLFSYSHSICEVLQKTLDEVCDIVNCPIGFYYFVSADEKAVTLKACSSETKHFLKTKDAVDMPFDVAEAGVWTSCLRERNPVIYNRNHSLPGDECLFEGYPEIIRRLIVPVVRRDRVVALLEIGNKPLDFTEQDLQCAIYFADIAWTIVEYKQTEEKIRYISFHDMLTGLYNRAFLEEEMQRLDTEGQLPISVIMADLNSLKLVNDTFGHGMGDEMLKSIAAILKSSCRKEDIVARWGGDEFVILLPQTTRGEVENICKRIRDRCCSAYVDNVPISLALGFSTKRDMATALSDIVKEAEEFMYKRKFAESRKAQSAVLNVLLKTLKAKSYETEEHFSHMNVLALEFGKKLGLPDSELKRLRLLIALRDIGKINISEDILTKTGPLTEAERDTVKKHPEIGFRIVRSTEEFAHIAEDVLSHHEHWDGSGYPRGLKGTEIPFLARIISIIDAYTVMTIGGPCKKKLPLKEAAEEIKRGSGTLFDPELAALFTENIIRQE